MRDNMIAAHHRGMQVHEVRRRASFPVGVNIAIAGRPGRWGRTAERDRKREEVYGPWLRSRGEGDFRGRPNLYAVQSRGSPQDLSYRRTRCRD